MQNTRRLSQSVLTIFVGCEYVMLTVTIGHRVPKTRKIVLGDEHTASIFELILRFAKRIRE